MLYRFLRFVSKILANIFYRFRVIGQENIAMEGRLIICSNHMHVYDPILIAVASKRVIHFMAKKELFNGWKNKFMHAIHTIPVNRDGNDIYSLKLALQILKNEQALGIFPEGGRNVNGDLTYKPGISVLAVKTKTKIVPVFIETSYKIFSKITIVIGKPYELKEYYGKRLTTEEHETIANQVIAKSINNLRDVLPSS